MNVTQGHYAAAAQALHEHLGKGWKCDCENECERYAIIALDAAKDFDNSIRRRNDSNIRI